MFRLFVQSRLWFRTFRNTMKICPTCASKKSSMSITLLSSAPRWNQAGKDKWNKLSSRNLRSRLKLHRRPNSNKRLWKKNRKAGPTVWRMTASLARLAKRLLGPMGCPIAAADPPKQLSPKTLQLSLPIWQWLSKKNHSMSRWKMYRNSTPLPLEG